MICATCQTPAHPGQKFCRSCGSMLEVADTAPAPGGEPAGSGCPNCQHDNSPGRKFCRACGIALSPAGELARPSRAMPLPTDDEPTIVRRETAEDIVTNPTTEVVSPLPPTVADRSACDVPTGDLAPTGPPCEMCGAPASGRRFCLECEPPAATRTQTRPRSPVTAVAPDPQVAVAARRRRRWPFVAGLLVLLVAGVSAALLLREDSEPQPVAASVTAPTGAAAPGPGDRSAQGSEPAAAAPAGESTTTTTTEGGASPATTTADEGEPSAAAEPPTADTGPENALREHWTAIGAGDFSAAYERFSSAYRRGRDFEDWSRGIRGFSPKVEIVEIQEIAKRRDRARVRLILVTRDFGAKGDAGRCHIFRGRVGAVREHGKWLYDPPGLRETRRGGIDPSQDQRCAPLFER